MNGRKVKNGTISPDGNYIKADGKWTYLKVGIGRRDAKKQGRPYKENALSRNRAHRDKINAAYRIRIKHRLLDIYGYSCNCCGEDNFKLLTLDHVNNNGNVHRKKRKNRYSLWLDAIKANDAAEYQILCYNCNCGRAHNGGICPHKE